MSLREPEHGEITVRLDRVHLAHILENAEETLDRARREWDGDPVRETPLWPTIMRLRTELGVDPDPRDRGAPSAIPIEELSIQLGRGYLLAKRDAWVERRIAAAAEELQKPVEGPWDAEFRARLALSAADAAVPIAPVEPGNPGDER